MSQRLVPLRGPLLLILAVGVFCRLLTLEEPLGCDQGIFTVIGHGLANGLVPPRDLWDNKPPLWHLGWIVSPAVERWGLSFPALAELVAASATSVLLMLAAEPSIGVAGGCVCGLLYTLHANGFAFGGWWTRSYPEVYLDVLLAAALALLCRSSRPLAWGAAGVLLGLTLWIKPSAFPMLALPLLVATTRTSIGRREAVWAVAGCAAAAVVPFAGVAVLGLVPEVSRALFGFNAEMLVSHGAVWPAPGEWLSVFFPFSVYLVALYVWGAMAVVARGPVSANVRLPLAWWALTVFGALAQRKLFASHYIGITAPLAWLAAAGWSHLDARVGRSKAMLLLLVSLVPWSIGTFEFGQQSGYLDRLLGKLTRQEFQDRFQWSSLGYSVGADRCIARRIQELAPPGSRILIFGARCGVYVWADRTPANRFYFNFPLVLPSEGPVSSAYRAEFLRTLEANPPVVLAVPTADVGIYEPLSSLELMRRWKDLRELVERRFVPVPSSPDYKLWVPAGT